MQSPKILYHYCATEAFHSIVANRTIRLSCLSLSNDSMEGRLVRIEMRKMAEHDGLDAECIQRLDDHLRFTEEQFWSLGFCLSETGDLLSQWRGYADNASGVSIGFRTEFLSKLKTKIASPTELGLSAVDYNPEAVRALITPTYNVIREALKQGGLKPDRSRLLIQALGGQPAPESNGQQTKIVVLATVTLLNKLFTFKSGAFSEESEWRLHLCPMGNKEIRLSYRSSGTLIVPYFDLPYLDPKDDPICEVILGPRHQTPESIIEGFLTENGFGAAIVHRSVATYR